MKAAEKLLSEDKITDRIIIAADKGWTIVLDGGAGLCHPERIIAWAIERGEGDWDASITDQDRVRLSKKRSYYSVIPITVEGAFDPIKHHQKFAIKEPGGWYILPYDSSFKNKQDLIAYWRLLEEAEAKKP